MGRLRITLAVVAALAVVAVLFSSVCFVSGDQPISSLSVYRQGGAPAVIQSPACSSILVPILAAASNSSITSSELCQLGTGRLKPSGYQEGYNLEDSNMFCDLNMHIPFLGRNGLKDVKVGMLAMFDDHIASKPKGTIVCDNECFTDFQLMDQGEETDQLYLLWCSRWSLPEMRDDTIHAEILKEALSRTMHDIDLAFSKGLTVGNHIPGCVGTVVLLVKGHILVANGCNSKSLLCTWKIWDDLREPDNGHWFDLSEENSLANYQSHPQIYDQPAQSQSVNNVQLSRYDSMVAHQMMDWRSLTKNDTHVVVTSAAVFERLPRREICSLATGRHTIQTGLKMIAQSCNYPPSLPDCVVDSAHVKGEEEGVRDYDNLSAAIIELKGAGFGILFY